MCSLGAERAAPCSQIRGVLRGVKNCINNNNNEHPSPRRQPRDQPDKGPPRSVREPDRHTTTQHLPTYIHAHAHAQAAPLQNLHAVPKALKPLFGGVGARFEIALHSIHTSPHEVCE